MVRRKDTVSEQLRKAIESAPVSRYRIAQETGVTEGALSRFVRRERGLDLSSVDKLAAYLGLVLVAAERADSADSTDSSPSKER